MPTTFATKFLSKHKTASVSITISILEMVVVWGVVAIVQFIPQQHTPSKLVSITSTAWILGSVSSIVLAAATIIVDSRREIGVLTLILALAVFIICGLPMLV